MTKTLATTRLILRRPERADAAEIVRHLNNYRIAKNTARIPFPYGEADAGGFLTLVEGSQHHFFALAEKTAPGALIGLISLEYEDNPADSEIGYWLAEPFWGRGLMSEAAREIVRFGFDEAGFKIISAAYHLGNEASRRILEGLGFVNTKRETGFSLAQGKDVELQRLKLNLDFYVNAKERGQ
ncbi:MAG: GNAT family N-acetyltransferase [Aestuariivirga sp.]